MLTENEFTKSEKSIISVLEVFGENRKAIEDYIKMLTTPKGKLSISKHKKLFASGNEISCLIESISGKYRITIGILKYLMLHPEIQEIPLTCQVCGKPLNHSNGIIKTCSFSCGNIYSREKREQTTIERFGVDNAAKAKSVIDKIKKTNLERYGTESAAKSEIVKAKAKKTNLERYGCVAATQNEEIKAKATATSMSHYGVENPAQSDEVKDKTKETNMKKYGVEYSCQAEEVKQKIRETNLERYGSASSLGASAAREKAKATWINNYGVDNPAKAPEVQEKIKRTNLERYGVENPYQAESVKTKIRETMQERFSVDSPLQSPQILAKVEQTNLDRYGVSNAMQAESVKNKVRKTMLARYGAEYSMQVKEIAERIRQTNLCRYGSEHTFTSEIIKEKIQKTHRTKKYVKFLEILNTRNISLINDYETYLAKPLLDFRCKICGEEFEASWEGHSQGHIWCPKCHKSHSSGEDQIYAFLADILGEEKILRNKRTILPEYKELDLYIPDYGLAIEFDCLYWHREETKGINYHINKTLECQKLGIRLMHIFENDWNDNREIIESIILSKLGMNVETIYARKCEIVELSSPEYAQFLDKNHLQGYYPAKIRLGLKYDGEIVACIGIGISRFNPEENEVIRFCSKKGVQVIGGLSKLLHYCTKTLNIGNLISYVDLRYFDSSGYIRAGFSIIGRSKPGYIYVKGNTILSRYQCQKHLLPNLLGNSYRDDLSESENMALAGYYKVYDCGMLKLEYCRK